MEREQIDEILKGSIGEAEVKMLVENKHLLTDKELKELGFIPPAPAPGPELPNDPELEAMPVRTKEEVETTLKKKGKKS